MYKLVRTTANTDEAREVGIYKEIYAYVLLDPSFLDHLRQTLGDNNDEALAGLKVIAE